MAFYGMRLCLFTVGPLRKPDSNDKLDGNGPTVD
jgi:hypothetical protein